MNQYAIRTITCAGCGKVTSKRLRPTQRYCSLACYRRSSRPQRKNGQEGACQLCGKPFYLPHNRLEQANAYFCCVSHANTWQGRNKTSHTCKICGKVFMWSPSRHEHYNILYCSLACRDADPDRKVQLRRMNAKQLAMHPNNLELLGYGLLDGLGIPYERQRLIGDKFCVDAFVPSLNLVIQFDGDYWHGNSQRFPEPSARQRSRMRLDNSQDAYMTACGYRVIRVWEHDIKKCPSHVTALLQAALVQP